MGIFWFKPNMRNSALPLTFALPSSDIPNITLYLGTRGSLLLREEPSAATVVFDHYNDVIMGAMASQIPNLAVVCSTVYWGADQRKHQSSASLAFTRGIHRWPVDSPHKWPVTRKSFHFMTSSCVKYALSPLKSSNVLRTISCWHTVYTLKRVAFIVQNQCRHYVGYKTVNLQALFMKYDCFTSVDIHYHIGCCIGGKRQITFSCNTAVQHTDFNKSRPTFQDVPGNTKLILL